MSDPSFDHEVPESFLMTPGSAERHATEVAEKRFGPRMVANPRWMDDRAPREPVEHRMSRTRTTDGGGTVDEPWSDEYGFAYAGVLEAERRFGASARVVHPRPDPPGYLPVGGKRAGDDEADKRFVVRTL